MASAVRRAINVAGYPCEATRLLISSLVVSLALQGPELYIETAFENHGDDPRFPNDENVLEQVFMRILRVSYVEYLPNGETCRYNHVFRFIEFKPLSS